IEVVNRLHRTRAAEHVLQAAAHLLHAPVVAMRIEVREGIDAHGVTPDRGAEAREYIRLLRRWRGARRGPASAPAIGAGYCPRPPRTSPFAASLRRRSGDPRRRPCRSRHTLHWAGSATGARTAGGQVCPSTLRSRQARLRRRSGETALALEKRGDG